MSMEGSVEFKLGSIITSLEGINSRMDKADESRAKIYTRIDEMAQRETRIESEVNALKTEVGAIKAKVDAQQAITDVVKSARDHAIVAGRLGTILWKIGKVLLAAAAGAATTWYSLTGKPPP